MKWLAAAIVLSLTAAEPLPTELFLRGHAVIPTPQKVTLRPGDVVLDEGWTMDAPAHIASRWLAGDMKDFQGLELKQGAGAKSIVLRVRAGAVGGGPAETQAQAYRLVVRPGRIEVTGNGDAGLLYGVQTLVQLVKRGPRGALTAPECEIEDWPRLALRFLHWDTKHHQDKLTTLKRYLDWAVRFKVNMIGFELEDKFSYPSNPVIGAPGAFTPAELQELVDYGLERFIQVVPIVQSPAHMAYVLKHPQFATLRADGNNYQSCLCLEDTYKLIFQMYDDLIAATKGIDYFFVSTDEVYYAGIGANCKQPYTPENRSALWAEFAKRAHDHLAGKGRRMLAWLEYPLLAKDLEKIPSGVIDGVVGEDSYVEIEKRKGMRQLVYTSTQGAEFLFPDHLAMESMPAGTAFGEFEEVFTPGRLSALYRGVAEARAMTMNPIGVFAAAWDDSGLHNETFWLGWSAVARWGWRPGMPGAEQHASEFMQVYYGPQTTGMVEIYRTLQSQARAWQRTWDRVISRVRAPGYGNSEGKGIGTARHDLTLEAPALPDGQYLEIKPRFTTKYRAWVAEASGRSLENDRLRQAIVGNMLTAERNRYNLEVLLALARFTGHHWRLLSALGDAEQGLEKAAAEAKQGRAAMAVGHLVAAHNLVAQVEQEAPAISRDLTAVFEKSRKPKGMAAGGRQFVHVLDDSKDHWADRTPDLGFMFAPERSIGLPAWRAELSRITKVYAAAHKVAVRGLAMPRLEE
ncbi:MAG: beta-N-acetylhexosaminidase [Acidobacteria bacterium]|nr:beta-N-acetylhexosaminidase [Acidobacteriota bacterium]